MYNVPSFTLARAIGGLVAFYWRSRLKRDDVQLIVVASVGISHDRALYFNTSLTNGLTITSLAGVYLGRRIRQHRELIVAILQHSALLITQDASSHMGIYIHTAVRQTKGPEQAHGQIFPRRRINIDLSGHSQISDKTSNGFKLLLTIVALNLLGALVRSLVR